MYAFYSHFQHSSLRIAPHFISVSASSLLEARTVISTFLYGIKMLSMHAQVFSTLIVSTIVNASAWRYSPPLPFSEGGHINADLPLDLAPKSIDVLYILLASRAILQNISTSVGFALLRSAFGPHCTPSDLVPSCVLDYILLTIHLLYRYSSGQAITYRCVLCSSDTSRSYSDVLCI